MADRDLGVKAGERGGKGGVVSPWTRRRSGWNSPITSPTPSRTAVGDVGEALIGAHEVEVVMRVDLEEIEHLVQHLRGAGR